MGLVYKFTIYHCLVVLYCTARAPLYNPTHLTLGLQSKGDNSCLGLHLLFESYFDTTSNQTDTLSTTHTLG